MNQLCRRYIGGIVYKLSYYGQLQTIKILKG